jgi:hypothetical protein
MAFIRIPAAFVLAVVAATVFGSLFSSYMTQSALIAAGAEFPVADRFSSAMSDFVGIAPAYGVVIAIALGVGFLVAAILRRVIKPLAPVAFPIAGAAAVGAALALMSIQYYSTTPIAGARGALGFALQCLAGGIGGFVFAGLLRRRA